MPWYRLLFCIFFLWCLQNLFSDSDSDWNIHIANNSSFSSECTIFESKAYFLSSIIMEGSSKIDKSNGCIFLFQDDLQFVFFICIVKNWINLYNTICFDITFVGIMEFNFDVSSITFVLTVDPEMISLFDWGFFTNFWNWTSTENLVRNLNIKYWIFHAFEFLSWFVKLSSSNDNFESTNFSFLSFNSSEITSLTWSATHLSLSIYLYNKFILSSEI